MVKILKQNLYTRDIRNIQNIFCNFNLNCMLTWIFRLNLMPTSYEVTCHTTSMYRCPLFFVSSHYATLLHRTPTLVLAFSNQNNPEHLSLISLDFVCPFASHILQVTEKAKRTHRMLSFSRKLDIITHIDRDEQNKDIVPVLNFGSGNT